MTEKGEGNADPTTILRLLDDNALLRGLLGWSLRATEDSLHDGNGYPDEWYRAYELLNGVEDLSPGARERRDSLDDVCQYVYDGEGMGRFRGKVCGASEQAHLMWRYTHPYQPLVAP